VIESLILAEGHNASEEALRTLSLRNAKQLVVGRVPADGVVLHVAATTPADFATALADFAKVPNVTQVLTLMLRTSR
jgi:hypothetical protein